MCETYSNILTIKTPERRPGVFIVNFEHVIADWVMCLQLSRICLRHSASYLRFYVSRGH